MEKTILIVAGETSGDNLGSEIIHNWKKISAPKYRFWGFGGSRMWEAGVEVVRDIHDLSVIGFLEGVASYSRLSRYLNNLLEEVKNRNVCGAILIDYPGFNLKLAEKLFSMNIPVYQVVSPQLWAWHYNRIFKIEKYVKAVLCLYKFETEIYHEHGISAFFMGHPLVQKIEKFNTEFSKEILKIKNLNRDKLKVALLPGSRTSEIRRHMTFLINAAAEFHSKHPDTIFEIPTASEKISAHIRQYNLPAYIYLRENNAYMTMATSDSAIVCSGTATLECAIFKLPFLLIYKTSWITYFIGKRLIHLPFIGLVNILRNAFVTREFIQQDMQISSVLSELEKISFDKAYRNNMKKEFQKVKTEVYSKNPSFAAAEFLSKAFSKNL